MDPFTRRLGPSLDTLGDGGVGRGVAPQQQPYLHSKTGLGLPPSPSYDASTHFNTALYPLDVQQNIAELEAHLAQLRLNNRMRALRHRADLAGRLGDAAEPAWADVDAIVKSLTHGDANGNDQLVRGPLDATAAAAGMTTIYEQQEATNPWHADWRRLTSLSPVTPFDELMSRPLPPPDFALPLPLPDSPSSGAPPCRPGTTAADLRQRSLSEFLLPSKSHHQQRQPDSPPYDELAEPEGFWPSERSSSRPWSAPSWDLDVRNYPLLESTLAKEQAAGRATTGRLGLGGGPEQERRRGAVAFPFPPVPVTDDGGVGISYDSITASTSSKAQQRWAGAASRAAAPVATGSLSLPAASAAVTPGAASSNSSTHQHYVGAAGLPTPAKINDDEGDGAVQRGRSASNPVLSKRLLSTATNESLALRSFQHINAGNDFSTLFSGLHLDDPSALIPASSGASSPPSSGGASSGGGGQPRPVYGPSPNNKKVDLYKTELCRQWEEKGWCDYKERCQFAHGPAELRPIQRHPLYKTQVCKAFVETGHCQYGRRCTFRHDVNTASSAPPGLAPTAETDKPLLARLGRASEPPPTTAGPHHHASSHVHHRNDVSRIVSSTLSAAARSPTAPAAVSMSSSSANDSAPRNNVSRTVSDGGLLFPLRPLSDSPQKGAADHTLARSPAAKTAADGSASPRLSFICDNLHATERTIQTSKELQRPS